MHGPHDPTGDPRSWSEREGSDHALSPLFFPASLPSDLRPRARGGDALRLHGRRTEGRVSPRSPTTSVAATETRWPIKRVLYVMPENRSFDNIYATFPGANGSTTGVKFGQEVPLEPSPHWLPGDLPHDRGVLEQREPRRLRRVRHRAFGDPWAYTMYEESTVPVYWQWARDYVLSDNYFCSVGGPSYPNHLFFVAGTSGGVLDNLENIETREMENGRQFKSWGCDAVGEDVFVLVKDERGNLTKHDTCFTFRSVPQQLEEIGELGVLLGHPGPERVLLERAERHLGRVPHGPLAPRAHPPGRPDRRGHRRRHASCRHVGHAAVRARVTRPRAPVTRRTGSRAS